MEYSQINELVNIFDVDIKEIEQLKYSNPLGNYVKKLRLPFSFNDKLIKLEKINGLLYSKYLKPYKGGNSQTWSYIIDALFFFGLINSRKVNDNDLISGIEINEFEKFTTFEEYLLSDESFDRIRNNFKSEMSWYKKIIVGSVIRELEHTDVLTQNFIKKWETKRYSSKYQYLLEYLWLSFAKEEPKAIPKVVFEKTSQTNIDEAVKNIIKSTENETLLVSSSIEEIENSKRVRSLRTLFRNELDKQFNEYKITNNIVSEYANTFDLNMKIEGIHERAHIIPVYYLARNGRWEDIANPDNGLILDPNTHRRFDKNIVSIIWKNGNAILKSPSAEFIIPDRLLTKKRISFLKEWEEIFIKK